METPPETLGVLRVAIDASMDRLGTTLAGVENYVQMFRGNLKNVLDEKLPKTSDVRIISLQQIDNIIEAISATISELNDDLLACNQTGVQVGYLGNAIRKLAGFEIGDGAFTKLRL